ncbi:MAG: hypothetical protein KDA24_28920 [Deltaproteobacteria bacterium]|nr:hypothetical protein [Deltaproteobacteria bacterium]
MAPHHLLPLLLLCAVPQAVAQARDQDQPQSPSRSSRIAAVTEMMAPWSGNIVPIDDSFCGPDPSLDPRSGPIEEALHASRAPICASSTATHAWALTAPHYGMPHGVYAQLERRSFADPAAAAANQRHMLSYPGSLSWCNALVTWEGTTLWTLTYGCGVSKHVGWVHDIRALMLAHADTENGVAGLAGTLGGSFARLGPDGSRLRP